MVLFGEFRELCQHVPSYAICNLFYFQLQRQAPAVLGPDSQRPFAPVGINSECGIYKVHTRDSLSNIVNNVTCAIGIVLTATLLWGCQKRVAAVGRAEFRALLATYLASLFFQLLSAGALLEQGTRALATLTAIHAGIVASLFWVLLWNAFTMTQVLEDGRMGSIMAMHVGQFAFFFVTMYIALDTALGFTSAFGSASNPPELLRSIPLFVLTSIWPAAAALVSLMIFVYVVIHILNETRPLWIYVSATISFSVAQVFRLSPVGASICESSRRRVDGSFIATVLETVSVVILYYGWADITKASWDD